MTKPTTLITGAGRRIGAALARHLAAAGHDLVLHYRTAKAEAEALAAEVRATPAGPSIKLVQADLERVDALGHFWQGLPPVNHIIHNASHYVRDQLESFTIANLRAHLAVNLEAPLLLTQGYLAQLPAGPTGNVIVLGDGYDGWTVSPEFFTYATSKHAWGGVIDLVAAACAPRARANVIALAPTLQGQGEDDALFERLAARAPLKRTGSLDEVCAAVDFLLASPGVTGQTISLGNGMGLMTRRPVSA